MIALARAAPTPGNLSSSSAEAELISIRPAGSSALGDAGAGTVALGAAADAGGVDLDAGAGCAPTGAATSVNATKKYPSLMVVLPQDPGHLILIDHGKQLKGAAFTSPAGLNPAARFDIRHDTFARG